MKRILITGGAVHANLDPVKMVTNKFKGGRIAELAEKISHCGFNNKPDYHVTYLCANGSVIPKVVDYQDYVSGIEMSNCINCINVIYHNGFEDYREKVKELAPTMDAVILGAAVANLIPVCYYEKPDDMIGAFNSVPTAGNRIPMPLKDKFPSHKYKPGDRIFMEWTIAPRVVDEVKSVMKKGAHLFAFKLLKDVKHEELIEAAYDIVLESGATCVFANDANDLDIKHAVTKEHSEIKMEGDDYIRFIEQCIEDEYYQTEVLSDEEMNIINPSNIGITIDRAKKLLKQFEESFSKKYGDKGYLFGTVAVRNEKGSNSFVTTARGKTNLNELSFVFSVDHDKKIVHVDGKKASLNAPLLHHIFEQCPDVMEIVHYHGTGKDFKDVPVFPYATPGTVRDSIREVPYMFEIEHHGMFICFE